MARVLALAHHWQGLIRSGAVRDQAELARMVGVSRARITQVMDLLHLAPELQQEILFLKSLRPQNGAADHVATTRIAAEPLWDAQRRTWAAMRTCG